jgi:MarR family transcriptional repressor of emrRAB
MIFASLVNLVSNRYYIGMGNNTEVGLLDLMDRVTRLVHSEERAQTQDPAFREVHLLTLKFLSHCNRYSNTPSALGAFLGTTKGTVSQSIKVLEDRNLVEKYEDRDDRRVIRLRLTVQGRAFVKRKMPSSTLSKTLEQQMSKEEHGRLGELLLMALRTIQAETGRRAFGVCSTCRHFKRDGLGRHHQCGLTLESLTQAESGLICREHEFPVLDG